jgi:hypothetical protein
MRSMSKYRIGLTCDFHRFVPEGMDVTNFQYRNLAWLGELLHDALTQAEDVVISTITPPKDAVSFIKSLGNTVVYEQYVQDPILAWAQHYDTAEPQCFSGLYDKLEQQDLIIGFEIPPTIRRYLHSRKKKYINLYIHPLRFLRDLCFGATTNCPVIASMLDENQCNILEISQQVRRFRALFTRLQIPACSVPAGVPLLIGQTACDSVLLDKGAFANWSTYQDILVDTLAPFDTVALLEHPYQPNSASIIEFLRGSLAKNVIAIKGNSYGVVFSNPDTPAVITLASSLGVEAQAIGHKTTFIQSDPRSKFLIPGVDCSSTPMIGHAVFTPQFWAGIMKGEPTMGTASGEASFFMGEHYMRNSLDAWSYRAIQYALTVEPSARLIAPSQSLTDEKLKKLAVECRGASHATDTSLAQSIEKAQSQGIALRFLPKALAFGGKCALPIHQAEGAYYLYKGFHHPESWGVWSSERHSALLIPLAVNDGEMTRATIEIEVKVFEGIVNKSPVLKISTAEQDIGYVMFRPSSMHPEKLVFEVFTSSATLQIYFELTHTASPAEIYSGSDTRLLGFGINSVNIISSVEDENATTSINANDCKVWGIDPELVINIAPKQRGAKKMTTKATKTSMLVQLNAINQAFADREKSISTQIAILESQLTQAQHDAAVSNQAISEQLLVSQQALIELQHNSEKREQEHTAALLTIQQEALQKTAVLQTEVQAKPVVIKRSRSKNTKKSPATK